MVRFLKRPEETHTGKKIINNFLQVRKWFLIPLYKGQSLKNIFIKFFMEKYPEIIYFLVPVMRQNYQDPLGMSKKFRQRLKMIALRWFTKFQRGFAKNFLVKI